MTSRIRALDLARGVGIIGMLASHVLWFGYGSDSLVDLSRLEAVGVQLVELFVPGKFTALFAIMFGIGLGLQAASAERRGVPFHRYALPRLGIIAALGLTHGLFIFWGDVLLQYAVAGVLVVSLYAAGRLAQLLAVGVLGLGSIAYAGMLFGGLAPPDGAFMAALFGSGSLADVQAGRTLIFLGRLVDPYTLTLAACIVGGYVIARSGILEDRAALAALTAFALPVVLIGSATGFLLYDEYALRYLLGVVVGPFFGLFYFGVIMLVVPRGFAPLEAVGKRSLSLYITHSLILVAVFYSGGLGLYGMLSPLEAFAFFVAFSLLLVMLARIGAAGPLETLLRNWTRRSSSPVVAGGAPASAR